MTVRVTLRTALVGIKKTNCFRLLLIGTLHSRMDSDLEAFSHNPTDGSFAALAVQPTA